MTKSRHDGLVSAVTSDDALNTGYTPFQHGPVYIGLTDPSGAGTTSFDYL